MNVIAVYGNALYHLCSKINEFSIGKDFEQIKIKIIKTENPTVDGFMAIIEYQLAANE